MCQLPDYLHSIAKSFKQGFFHIFALLSTLSNDRLCDCTFPVYLEDLSNCANLEACLCFIRDACALLILVM